MQNEHYYCQNCGARLEPSARFCSKCGIAVNGYAPTPVQVEPARAPAPVQAPAGITPSVVPLFDPTRRYYAVKREWWGWGSGHIYDERGNIIGHMNRRLISMREATEFREADDRTVSALIHKKLVAIRDTLDIKDGREQMLGRVKQKILAILRPEVWMEDASGKKILEAKGNFLGFSFKVYDMSGNLVAQIDKTDIWKDIFVGGSLLDFSQYYAIVIYSSIDRRLIVPLAVAIDEAIHEDRKGR